MVPNHIVEMHITNGFNVDEQNPNSKHHHSLAQNKIKWITNNDFIDHKKMTKYSSWVYCVITANIIL